MKLAVGVKVIVPSPLSDDRAVGRVGRPRVTVSGVAVEVGVVGRQVGGRDQRPLSSAVGPVSSTATGASLTAVTVIVTVAVSVPPLPSETV